MSRQSSSLLLLLLMWYVTAANCFRLKAFSQKSQSYLFSTLPSKLTDVDTVLEENDIFVFDCDGVIWKGDSLLSPKVPKVLNQLRALKKRIFFITNNSTKSRKGYLKKFVELGLNINAEEILSSSFAAAIYFQKHPLKLGNKAYIIGQRGICEELVLAGVPFCGGEEDSHKSVQLGPGARITHDPDVEAVVVGFDAGINYYKIQYAQLCLHLNQNCRFVATNLDAVTHLTEEQEWAGNGAMVGAIKGCTNKDPIVVGKPAPLLIDYLADNYGVDRRRVCMIGDRLDTDIRFGLDNGLNTILTLSGVTKYGDLVHSSNSVFPQYYVDSIIDLFPSL